MGNDPVVYLRCMRQRATSPDPEVQPGVSELDSCIIQELDSCIIQEPNAPANIVVETSTPFTKVWRLKNTGTVVWPQKKQLVWTGGIKVSNQLSFQLEIPATGLAVGQELDVVVDFVSPEVTGWYISYWRMASPSGEKFGQSLRVLTTVINQDSASPQIYLGPKVESGISKLDGRIIRGLNAPTLECVEISPSTLFTKIWRVKNSGTVAWPQKTRLVWIEGKKLRNVLSVELEIPAAGLAVGEEIDVAVDLISPCRTGRFVSLWRLTSPFDDMFGQYLVVLLRVNSPVESVLDGHATSSVLPVPSSDSYRDEDSENDYLCKSYFPEHEFPTFHDANLSEELLKITMEA